MIKKALALFLFLWVSMAWANPPMKVISSVTTSTRFDMKWPYHTVTTYNANQTIPYHTTGRILYLVTHEDVSKYRYHYPQNTCRNEWGYFFPPGTKLCSRHPAVSFGPPDYYTVAIYPK